MVDPSVLLTQLLSQLHQLCSYYIRISSIFVSALLLQNRAVRCSCCNWASSNSAPKLCPVFLSISAFKLRKVLRARVQFDAKTSLTFPIPLSDTSMSYQWSRQNDTHIQPVQDPHCKICEYMWKYKYRDGLNTCDVRCHPQTSPKWSNANKQSTSKHHKSVTSEAN